MHCQLDHLRLRLRVGQDQREHTVLQLGGAGGGVDRLGQLPDPVYLARRALDTAHLHAYAFDADLIDEIAERNNIICL